MAHLAGLKWILQVDAYAGYDKLAEGGQVQLAFCQSHVRCNPYELAILAHALIASKALEDISEFYDIEKDIRDRSAEECRFVR